MTTLKQSIPAPAFLAKSGFYLRVASFSPLAERLKIAADHLLGGALLFAVVFGPWAFGTTQPWAIQIMNGVGLTAWGLLAGKWAFGRVAGCQSQWEERAGTHHHRRHGRRVFQGALAVATALLLGYCLISAVNARATYRPEQWSFDYHDAISWLPHSYESESSWRAFWMYLGVAGLFWAAREWILAGARASRAEGQESGTRHRAREQNPLLPRRLRVLLWVLSVNGGLLALEGIIQRTMGTNQLLWLVEPAINNTAISQFGPYAYRANAAQYFNLLWPVTLGLWWTYQRARRNGFLTAFGAEGSRHHLLLSCAILMAVCPIVSTSRGGAIVMVASALLSGGVLLLAQWRSTWTAKLAVFVLLGGMVGGGVLLGWEELGPRLEMFKDGMLSREALFLTGWRMASECPLFGTGPGTFGDLFQLFRRMTSDYWAAQLHNDWLETFITFGWIGSSLVGLGLGTVLLRWFSRGGVYGEKHFVMLLWISLLGCLIHAFYDFPLQIHSILTVFVLLCSVLSCLSRRP